MDRRVYATRVETCFLGVRVDEDVASAEMTIVVGNLSHASVST